MSDLPVTDLPADVNSTLAVKFTSDTCGDRRDSTPSVQSVSYRRTLLTPSSLSLSIYIETKITFKIKEIMFFSK